jgi:hypothetical protein
MSTATLLDRVYIVYISKFPKTLLENEEAPEHWINHKIHVIKANSLDFARTAANTKWTTMQNIAPATAGDVCVGLVKIYSPKLSNLPSDADRFILAEIEGDERLCYYFIENKIGGGIEETPINPGHPLWSEDPIIG